MLTTTILNLCVITFLLFQLQSGLMSLFEICHEHVTAIGQEDLLAHQTSLLKFYCEGMDLRNNATQVGKISQAEFRKSLKSTSDLKHGKDNGCQHD